MSYRRMTLDPVSQQKRLVRVGDARVAYREEEGSDPPVVLLHGCPFSSFVRQSLGLMGPTSTLPQKMGEGGVA